MTIRTLPRSIPLSSALQSLLQDLQEGCYVLRYQETLSLTSSTLYDGTIRIERDDANLIGSGDLYLSRNQFDDVTDVSAIPIFPISDYRHYLQITNITDSDPFDGSFTLEFERFRYLSSLLTSFGTPPWTSEGVYTAQIYVTSTPSGDELSGEVQNPLGQTEGTLTMMRVSNFLRRAVLEIDKLATSPFPQDNGFDSGDANYLDWKTGFERVGWDLTVIENNPDIDDIGGVSWSDAELHFAMIEERGISTEDLDKQWRYHLLCISQLDEVQFPDGRRSRPLGIMYDNEATDSNSIPREGAAIAFNTIKGSFENPNLASLGAIVWPINPNQPYFRTAVHELGHAIGLRHDQSNNGFMASTSTIIENRTDSNPFPDNIKWEFALDDQQRLRHMPDMWLRPGGIPFHAHDVIDTDSDSFAHIESVSELTLEVSPVSDVIPMGAPVRIEIALKNTSDHSVKVPSQVSLKAENVKGKVIDPSGNIRTFQPLIMCMDTVIPLDDLSPNDQKTHSETLLRGGQGALFPMSGVHRIMVDVEWEEDEKMMKVTGETFVMVTPPVDDAHAKAALKILSTPDTLLTLVIGGDHLTEGIEAIKTALDNEILAPHYQMVEAKRLSKKFKERQADYSKACECLDKEIVMSKSEEKQATEMRKHLG